MVVLSNIKIYVALQFLVKHDSKINWTENIMWSTSSVIVMSLTCFFGCFILCSKCKHWNHNQCTHSKVNLKTNAEFVCKISKNDCLSTTQDFIYQGTCWKGWAEKSTDLPDATAENGRCEDATVTSIPCYRKKKQEK